MLARVLSPVWIALAIAGLFSCDRFSGGTERVARMKESLRPIPTKEDIFFLGPTPFKLNEYYTLREAYPTLSPENVLRLAAYTILLMKEAEAKPGATPPNPLHQAFNLARALLPPEPVGSEIDADLRKKESRRLNELLRSTPTEWNPGLLREIGVREKPWG